MGRIRAATPQEVTMRRLLTFPVGVILIMATAAPALAAPEQSRDVLVLDDETFTHCGEFDVVATDGVLSRVVQTWSGDNGEVTRELRHIQFDIVLTNSVTGESGSYTGQFNLVVTGDEMRFLGAYRQLKVDGANVLSASGHTHIDLNGDPESQLVFGHSSMDEWEAGVCAALR
jgi:hypothetical protein